MRISRKSSGWKLPLYTWRNSGRHPAGRLGFFHDRAGLSKYLTQTFMSHGNEMICQPVTLSGYAEWPKVADAVIEASDSALYRCLGKASFRFHVWGWWDTPSVLTLRPSLGVCASIEYL